MTTNQSPMTKQKAHDHALWLMFRERKQNNNYRVVGNDAKGYNVVLASKKNQATPSSYADMSYEHIREIWSDTEPLYHWEEIAGIFSIAESELLRFILASQIPLEKFIRFELANRGYDENANWVGFQKAEKVWLG